ncbi:YfiR family protein [Thiorhodococcus mannitoliphagus]|uniref:YfiR family protein n=1 Tax=Thiorhodococcus mannitoliphagus TaxID=329406 RepID=A0A6P1DVM9_9GAMM|nr:YfiR family protein [Thiorhodococcus mannitoliphagus]NEX21243.1 YfiR family protein [Thiorhodococcus mannitoliphagus]
MSHSINSVVRALALSLVISAPVLLALGLESALGDTQTLWREDEQRLQIGLKIFPACLGAVESLDTGVMSDGRLLVLVVYEGSKAAARKAAASFESLTEIGGHPIRVQVRSAAALDVYAGERPGGIFVASPGLASKRLRTWSERQQAVVFSPFAGAVEEGAVAGIYVADRVLPSVNLAQARRAGIRFKSFFLEVAHHYKPFTEADLRATFLVNFPLFIEWPSSAFDSPSAPLRYCVLGNSALSSSLEQALAGERIGGHPMQLAAAQDPAQWRRCHILYVDQRAAEPGPRVLAAVEGAPVLSVGDTETFVREGGVVSLVHRGERLHPLINQAAAARAGIRISSKLLRLATLVSESPLEK